MFSYPDLGGADKVRFGLKGHARPQLGIKRAILYRRPVESFNCASIILKGKDDEHESTRLEAKC